MNKSIVEQIEFPLPPLAEQETIVAAAEGQLSVIDHLEADLDAESDRAERERKLDQALELTFPASEPIAVGRPTGTELAMQPALSERVLPTRKHRNVKERQR